MIALELACVTKRWGAHVALDRVSLAVPAGAAVGLLGPNGAGKTTALRLVLGLARPSLGWARLNGRDPFDPRARVNVGVVPERPRFPARTPVIDLLRLHALLAGVSDPAREVETQLARTGLVAHAHVRAGALSKGLAQRLAFAQALLGQPRLLLLDEPTSGLDIEGMRDARGWIAEARERGATIVVSSHVLGEVERLCDRLVVLQHGRIAASGAVSELVRPGETLEDAYVRIVRGAAA